MTLDAAAADGLWLDAAERYGALHWLDNVSARIERIDLGGQPVPLVLPAPRDGTSYVACPISAWARYPQEELRRRGRIGHALARPAVTGLAAWMRAAGLHRAASLGNWLVSTNLHPDASAADWRHARDAALVLAPDRPLIVRNVCPAHDAALAHTLRDAGWWLMPARRVYLCDPRDDAVQRRNNVRNDRRALNKAHLEPVDAAAMDAGELAGFRSLFRQLFIDKHSRLNPDFSDAFFAHCRDTGFLRLHGLRHEGRVVGVIGLMERHGWTTAPLLGYDTAAPKTLGLYRALMALSFESAAAAGTRLHLSSGAGEFKRARGGEPALEYSALYVRHLPPARRAAAGALVALMQRAAPPALARFG